MRNILKNTSQRITFLREHMRMSQAEFAKKISVSQGALSQIENGKSRVSLLTLKKICSHFKINSNWLLEGIGEIYRSENEQQELNARQKEIIVPYNEEQKLLIPLIKQDAHAGYISGCRDEAFMQTLDHYYIPGFDEGVFRMFEIDGDSMIPTLYHNEVIICRQVENSEHLANGNLYVLITEEGIVAKRVYFYDQYHSILVLKSDNATYKTYSINKEIMIEMWEIEAKITKLLGKQAAEDDRRLEKLESDVAYLRSTLRNLKRDF